MRNLWVGLVCLSINLGKHVCVENVLDDVCQKSKDFCPFGYSMSVHDSEQSFGCSILDTSTERFNRPETCVNGS